MSTPKPSRRDFLRQGATGIAGSVLATACASGSARSRSPMSTQFRPLSMYKKVPSPSLPGLAGYDPTVAPAGSWPLLDGAAARTGRGSEPMAHDRWLPRWHAPLGEAHHARGLLLGGGCVVAQGAARCAVWSTQGQAQGTLPVRTPAAWLDASGPRLLMDGSEGGLRAFRLPSGTLDCAIMLAMPSGKDTGQVLPGPDGILLVLNLNRSQRGRDEAVVEMVRTRDWSHVENGILYGLDPVAGVIREGDWLVDAALAKTGPVLVTAEAIVWCDWQLRVLAEQPHALKPAVVSVDGSGRAFVLGTDEQRECHLLVAAPQRGAPIDHPVPQADGYDAQPPLLLPDGCSYFLMPGEILALDAAGAVAWRKPCGPAPRGTLAANHLLLLADGGLSAVDRTGDTTLMWTPPDPLATPPLLVGGQVYVATAQELFALVGA
jgi:hypothetical protein